MFAGRHPVIKRFVDVRCNYQVSKLACFADDEEEEISENETPKVKKKKKAKKSKESKGSKRRSRREVRLFFFAFKMNEAVQ